MRLLAQETGRSMRRNFPLCAVAISVALASGCGGLGWYQAAGHMPGIAVTDYAFYNFCDIASQLYPASPPQIESSAIMALGDLGFPILGPPSHPPEGGAVIIAKALDGRPTRVTILPQNSLTRVTVAIGPVHIGDEELSRDLLRRISLNFGTVMRAFTPIDTAVPARINASRFTPRTVGYNPQLEGEGLRPDEKRDKAAPEEAVPEEQPVPATAPNVPAALQWMLQVNPNMQYVPFPIPGIGPNSQ